MDPGTDLGTFVPCRYRDDLGVFHRIVHLVWRYSWAGVELAPVRVRPLFTWTFARLDELHDNIVEVPF